MEAGALEFGVAKSGDAHLRLAEPAVADLGAEVRREHVAAEHLETDVGLVAVPDAAVVAVVGLAHRAADIRTYTRALREGGAGGQRGGEDGSRE